MLPKYHLVLGFLFSLVLFIFFPFISLLGFLIIFASSVLIDVDHYLYYVFKNKIFSINKAYNSFFEQRKKLLAKSLEEKRTKIANPLMYLFHGIEVLLIIFILGIFVNKIFLFIFIGFSFHLFLDIVEQIYYGFRIAKVSLIFDFVKKINEKF
ncbi:hypothetical protein HYS72_00975 [Candidatus Pacearchaeota archaeon]|nr:hypothetical protein [Candidatus Pacearchaeota archaeon]